MKLYRFSLFPEHTLVAFLFTEVTNGRELLGLMRSGSLDASLLDPAVVLSDLHLMVAANRALKARSDGHLTTKSLHAELLFYLSPSKSVCQTFFPLLLLSSSSYSLGPPSQWSSKCTWC
jgi:EKC/KEOPS complex subunit CGI121/TPRKB